MSEQLEVEEKQKKPENKCFGLFSDRTMKFLKYLAIFLCAIGLALQTAELFVQYNGGQTVVSINIETVKFDTIPAITVCYPKFISMAKMAETDPFYKQFFDDYKTVLNNSTDDPFDDKSVREELEVMYNNKFGYDILKDRKQLLRMHNFFNMSLPFTVTYNESGEQNSFDTSKVEVQGVRLYPNGTFDKEDITVEDSTPYESLVFRSFDDNSKCFTFFSHMNEMLRDYKMFVRNIHILFRHHDDWFPRSLLFDANLMFAMHSPNTIPQEMTSDNFVEIKYGFSYKIRYNQWKTILLPTPYQTNCKNYNMSDENDYRIRSDCINICIHEHLNTHCEGCVINDGAFGDNCTSCVFRDGSIWRQIPFKKTNFDQSRLCLDNVYFTRTLSDDFEEKLKKGYCRRENLNLAHSLCREKCQPECVQHFYNYELLRDIDETESKSRKYTAVKITHNQMPDHTTEHLPEMSFISFAANFGGLLGMWLGLSAMAIMHTAVEALL